MCDLCYAAYGLFLGVGVWVFLTLYDAKLRRLERNMEALERRGENLRKDNNLLCSEVRLLKARVRELEEEGGDPLERSGY
jgi:hypothetical protein